jgi:DNA-binding transcriptional ArsR family regulator
MLAMSISKTYPIHDQKQLAALAAAARQELVDVLEQMGTVSVAELAAALGRPADALYFHLRALTRVGLVENAGYRVRLGGKEALYRTIAQELQLRYEPRKTANRKAVSSIVDSMLRLAMRDFRRSFQPGNVVVSGAQRELWALRKVGRLSPAQVARLNDRIKGVSQEVSAHHRTGRLYAVTVILTPLDHRNSADRPVKAIQQNKLRTSSSRKSK